MLECAGGGGNKLITVCCYGDKTTCTGLFPWLCLFSAIENSNKTIKVNFHIIDILGSSGFDIKKVFVSEIKNDKASILQFRNKNK